MIYLLRHGEIEKDEWKCYIGQLDLPLAAKGIKQARNWQKELSKINFENIYTSDLERCVKTAQIIAGSRNITLKKELREIRLGEWEGLERDIVKSRFPEEWELRGKDMKYAPPGGESFVELYERVIPVFDAITKDNFNDILIITHAGVIRTIISYILGMPLDILFRIVQDYAGMNIIKNMGSAMKLIRMNFVLSEN